MYVYIRIKVPHIRVSSTELIVEGSDFTFFCKPYLLKLTLPYEVIDDENCKGTYDANMDDGTITVQMPKSNPGQHFPDLDLTTSLLQARCKKDRESSVDFPEIDVLNSVDFDGNETDHIHDGNETSLPDFTIISRPKYGFNRKYSGILHSLRDDVIEMIELEDPDNTPEQQRYNIRENAENNAFEIDRYIADLHDGENDSIYIEAIAMRPFWEVHWDAWKGSVTPDDAFVMAGGFSDDESELMTSLPKRDYSHIRSGSFDERSVLLSLVDLIFAYCYDVRVTGGEPTVESPFTIARLSATLSWFQTYPCSNNTNGNEMSSLTSLQSDVMQRITVEDIDGDRVKDNFHKTEEESRGV